jgi:hypothetical protein
LIFDKFSGTNYFFFKQKLIFVFALIAAVSCDVSHIVQGDGWYKDETGYHYTQPAAKFDDVVVEEVVVADEPAPVEAVEPEPIAVEIPVETPVETPVEEVVVADEPAPVEAVVPEVVEEVVADAVAEVADVPEAPVNNLREYLPPVAPADAKKKRQIPVKRVIRKVYRRFVPIKRH